MVKVKKVFGELPENVAVLDQMVEFDAEGNGEASEEAADVLRQIPGYEVEEAGEDAPKAKATPAPKAKPAPKTE